MLKKAKQVVLHAARAAGGFSLVRDSRWRGQRLLILGYHGVSLDDEHQWDGELFIPAAQLEQRLAMLRDGGYNVLRLDAALRQLYAGELPPRSVVLTFDDGFYDFYARAYPLLQQFGMPATVYLTTYYCVHQWPVFDIMCSYLLWKGRGDSIDTRALRPGGGTISLASDTARRSLTRDIRAFVRQHGSTTARQNDGLTEIAARLGLPYADILRERILHLMSPAEVSALDPALVDVQLHTHRHRVPLDEELFRDEIVTNREVVRGLAPGPGPADHFCYPSGVTSAEFLPLLDELGVRSATTCVPGIAQRDDDPRLLPRILDTTFIAPIEFEAWLTGTAAVLPRRALHQAAPTADGILP